MNNNIAKGLKILSYVAGGLTLFNGLRVPMAMMGVLDFSLILASVLNAAVIFGALRGFAEIIELLDEIASNKN